MNRITKNLSPQATRRGEKLKTENWSLKNWSLLKTKNLKLKTIFMLFILLMMALPFFAETAYQTIWTKQMGNLDYAGVLSEMQQAANSIGKRPS